MLTELSAAARACGQLIEADPVLAETAPEPLEAELEDHLAEAHRQQDRLADLLRTDPAENPAGWPLRGEILAHVDRLRTELQPRPVPEPDRVRRRAFMAGAAGRARRGAAGVRPAPGRSSGTPPTR